MITSTQKQQRYAQLQARVHDLSGIAWELDHHDTIQEMVALRGYPLVINPVKTTQAVYTQIRRMEVKIWDEMAALERNMDAQLMEELLVFPQ